MIIMKLLYPPLATRFSSVVVITFASHAKGPGFDPQLNHYFFFVSSFAYLVIQCSAFWKKNTKKQVILFWRMLNSTTKPISKKYFYSSFAVWKIISFLTHQMYTIYPCQNIEYPASDYDYLISANFGAF